MLHADEGTLHAYLDGELSPTESAEFERHLSVCVPCRAALAEAKGFLTEADQMITTLDAVAPRPAAVAIPTPRRNWHPRLSTMAWAATVILALGLGYSLRPGLEPAALPLQAVTDQTPAAASAPDTPPADAPHASAGERRPPAPRSRDLTTAEASKTAAPVRADVAEVVGAPAAMPATSGLALENRQAAPPAGMAAQGAGTAALAYVDGAPIDTTRPALQFGPGTPEPPRRITLDEAVSVLGGSIRLIDGLSPQRVELLAGLDVPGADPARQVVRVYYEEPDLGLVTLDQQRPGPSFAARDSRGEADPMAVTIRPAAPGLSERALARTALQSSTLTWRSDGTWFALTSRLDGSRMSQLQARVK